jgi:hypothetical protein
VTSLGPWFRFFCPASDQALTPECCGGGWQVLAKKMTVLYKLSREQLSKQHHYDFGLRALKSVLVMAGSLKRGAPSMSEQLVLMRALRDMNLPKFVFDDVPLFLGLINDLFPGRCGEHCLCALYKCMRCWTTVCCTHTLSPHHKIGLPAGVLTV